MSVCRPSFDRTLALATVAAAAIGLITISCGDSSPSTSTPPTTVSPEPTPTPGGGGGVGSSSCPFGKGSPYAVCDRETSSLLQDVEGAIDRVIEKHPEIFDLSREAAPHTRAYYVLDKGAYVQQLILELQAGGLCAVQLC